jgi:DNA-binding transcriptional MerR regulator
MPNDLITTAEVAVRLNRSVYTVNRYVREGLINPTMQLPGTKGARLFHPAEVDRFAATMPTEASA